MELLVDGRFTVYKRRSSICRLDYIFEHLSSNDDDVLYRDDPETHSLNSMLGFSLLFLAWPLLANVATGEGINFLKVPITSKL